jgi:hypothetical protein
VSRLYGDSYFLEAQLRNKEHPVIEEPPAPREPEPEPDSDGGLCSAAPCLSSAAWGLLVFLALRRRSRSAR